MDLKDLFKCMSIHTKDECGKCKVPHSCCSPEYCQMAKEYAKSKGVDLQELPHDQQVKGCGFLNKSGCIVEPHLRPLCTLHVCSINSFGFKPNDEIWTNEYFRLRDLIEEKLGEENEQA